MNSSVFPGILWKEYRTQRAFWIAMLILAALAQVAVLVFADPGNERLQWLYGIALAMPAFYALGCGAILFAAEHELETYEFQKILPVTAGRLFFSKLVLPVLAVPAMIGVLWLMAALLARGHSLAGRDQWHLWGLWGFAAVEALAWSVFFSLLTKRPITAAILAVATASFAIHMAAAPHIHSAVDRYWQAELYVEALPARAVIVALLAAMNVWLGMRWLRVEPVERRSPRWRAGAVVAAGASSAVLLRRNAGFGRLVWQHWRQSRRLMGTVWFGLLLLAFVAMAVWWVPSRHYQELLIGFCVLSPIAAALMGVCTFIADQQGSQFRFLVERGISPRKVWLSRQIVWATPVLVVGLIVTILAVPLSPHLVQDRLGPILRFRFDVMWDLSEAGIGLIAIEPIGWTAVGLLLAYAVAQLCSLLFRSSLLAGFLGLLLTGLLLGWTALMVWLAVPLLWSVWPIPIALLLASWVRTPQWLLERRSIHAWAPTVALLVIPTLAICASVAAYRVYSIPRTDPGFSPQQYARPATPAERATIDLYHLAIAHYVPVKVTSEVTGEAVPVHAEDSTTAREPLESPPRPEFIKANAEAISVALRASRRSEADFFDPFDSSRVDEDVVALGQLISASGQLLESEGKLEEAMDRYLAALRVSVHLRHRSSGPPLADGLEMTVYNHLARWAAHPRQTASAILAAANQVEKLTADLPEPSTAVESEYIRLRALATAQPEAITAGNITPQQSFRIYSWSRLPWERARAIRLLNVLTAEHLRRLAEAAHAAEEGGKIQYPRRQPYMDYYSFRTTKSTPLLDMVDPWIDQSGDFLIQSFARIETQRRAVRLILALHAYRADHGAFPEALDALKGRYLGQLPVDPMSGESFRYFPDGVSVRLTESPSPDRWLIETVDPGTPFLWSTGGMVDVPSRPQPAECAVQNYLIYDLVMGEHRRPHSDVEMWQAGWLFPIRDPTVERRSGSPE